MNFLRTTVVLFTSLSLLTAGGFATGCGQNAQQNQENEGSSGDESDGAGVQDAVEYGTGERQIEMGNEMEKSLDESTEKKTDQLDRVQDSSE